MDWPIAASDTIEKVVIYDIFGKQFTAKIKLMHPFLILL